MPGTNEIPENYHSITLKIESQKQDAAADLQNRYTKEIYIRKVIKINRNNRHGGFLLIAIVRDK